MATPPEGTANARDEDHLKHRRFFMNKKEVARLGAKASRESFASGVDFKERNKKIIDLRVNKKWTLDKIGIFFGVSRQRIEQIVGNTDNIKTKAFRIKKAVELQDLDVTKTTQEIKEITGRYSVNWFGLRHPASSGNAKLGYDAEEFVSKVLTDNGIPNKLTNSRPIDIILDNGLKLEVKSRSKSQPTKTSKNFYYFPLIRDVVKGTADFYILVINEDCFVIPSSDVPGHGGIGFVWPKTTSKQGRFSNWTEYHNRVDLLKGVK